MHISGTAAKALEQALEQRRNERYRLRLFVTGATPRSSRAIANTRTICETYLPGRYELEVIDIYRQTPSLTDEDIIVAPTLVKLHPLPLRRLIGDMSDLQRVLQGLGLPPAPDEVSA